MILRKLIKTVAIRCRISRIKCTKFDFGWGSAPDHTGELTALPRHLAGFTLHYIIIKTVATRCRISRIKCTKFN